MHLVMFSFIHVCFHLHSLFAGEAGDVGAGAFDACRPDPGDRCLRDHPSSTLSERQLLKWMDCGNVLDHSEPTNNNMPVLRSDHICRSLVDTSQHPAALNDAICMYIDYLTRDNDRVIGDVPTALGLPPGSQPPIGTTPTVAYNILLLLLLLLS